MKSIDLLKYGLVLTLTLSPACKRNTIGPDNGARPGKRDYVWTIDTLEYPRSFQTLMRHMWASSPANVYVVGHNDLGKGNMYRYNGQRWEPVPLTQSEGGLIPGSISLSAIHGFGPNNIYAVGSRVYNNPRPPPYFLDSSLIIHYDGTRWLEVPILRGNKLLCIWAESPSNIWAGGIYGTLYRYDGTVWSKQQYQPEFSINAGLTLRAEETYVLAYLQVEPINTYTVFERFDGSQWVRLDSTRFGDGRFGYAHLFSADRQILYSAGYRGIFRWDQGRWSQILHLDAIVTRLRGNAANNLFAVGRGLILHYNGIDWHRYPEFSDDSIHWSDVWTDGRQVFIVGNDGRRSYILHGR